MRASRPAIAVLVAGVVAWQGAITTPVVSAGEYRAMLETARVELATSGDGGLEAVRAGLADVRVRVHGVAVRPRVASGTAGYDEARFERRLDALITAFDEAVAAEPVGDETLDAALRRALADVETEPGWLDRLGRTVDDLLDRLISSVLFRGRLGPLLGLVLLVGGVVLVIWLLRRTGLVTDHKLAVARDREDAHRDWHAVADRAFADGDLEAALRAEYRALVEALIRMGAVEDRPSLTASECRAAVEVRAPNLGDAVAQATHAFELVAYGERPASRVDVERVRELGRTLATR